MKNPYQFTLESQLSQPAYLSKINAFWQTGTFSNFIGVDNCRIEYACFEQDNAQATLIISPGRSESYLKYKEVCFDLAKQGFNLYIIDHRGQGLSQRLIPNNNKGYVEQFDHYAQDLNHFYTDIVEKQRKKFGHSAPHILAHSMGCAIVTRFLQLFPVEVSSVALSSPMIAVSSGAIPKWFAEGLVNLSAYINKLFSKNYWYFLGQQNYQEKPFADNPLTHCPLRYQQLINVYNDQPSTQLGGVTIHWLAQAIRANHQMFAHLQKLNMPIQLLQSGADTIVSNSEQNRFCQQLAESNHHAKVLPVVIDHARHELFFELDKYRIPALTKIVDFFKSRVC